MIRVKGNNFYVCIPIRSDGYVGFASEKPFVLKNYFCCMDRAEELELLYCPFNFFLGNSNPLSLKHQPNFQPWNSSQMPKN